MSLHFVSHPWEVEDVEDGMRITIRAADLTAKIEAIFVDELIDLARESGRSNLWLDLSEIHLPSSILIGKMCAVNRRLREIGGRLRLCRLSRPFAEFLEAARLTDYLEIQDAPPAVNHCR